MKLTSKTFLVTAIATILLPFSAGAISINEIEANNTLATAQNVTAGFGLGANANIGSQFGIDPSVTPNVSIVATGNNTYDYYSFSLSATSRVTLDMDNQVGWSDSEVGIWRNNGGGSFTLLANSDDGNPVDPGSDSDPFGGLNAYLSITNLVAGNYVVGVGAYNTIFSNTGMGVNSNFASYTLHITADNPSSVPDGGSTLAMLGLALTGVAGLRRRFCI